MSLVQTCLCYYVLRYGIGPLKSFALSQFNNDRTLKKFYITPRWYSYGGMFESIFLGVNLALRLGRKPVLLYPSNHVVSGFQTPGFLNQELREIVLGSETLRCSTCSQLFLTKFLEVNRWVMKGDTFLCKLIRYLVKAVGWNLPVYIGFSGLNVSKELEKKIGRDGEICWRQILTSPHYIDLTHRQQSEGARIMQRLGIDQSEPFVCLYVRDNGYEKTRKTPDRPAVL